MPVAAQKAIVQQVAHVANTLPTRCAHFSRTKRFVAVCCLRCVPPSSCSVGARDQQVTAFVRQQCSGSVVSRVRCIVAVMFEFRRLASSILFFLGLTLSSSVFCCSGCTQGGQAALSVMPGVMNDPGNRSLRRSILRFGLEEFCTELTHTGAPLRMREDDPVMGRFFARSCVHNELENGDVFVQLDGVAYAWTNASLRVAFEANAAIQYNQDFLMDGSTMYAYFRTRQIASQNTRVTMVEQTGALGTGVASVAESVAPQVLRNQLERGFTVIRDTDGSAEFAVGVIEKGQRPAKPYDVSSKNRLTLMNERTEIRGNQLDFLGPFRVASNGDALFLTLTVDGTTAIDAMVIDENGGGQWLDRFVRTPGVPQPPIQPATVDIVPAGATWQKAVPLRKGYYYVVLDNSAVVGSAFPPNVGTLPPAALVSVVVQVGKAP